MSEYKNMPADSPCPHCGKKDWKRIPDSLAQACTCGFVRVEDSSGDTFSQGASIQQWLNETCLRGSGTPLPDPHKRPDATT